MPKMIDLTNKQFGRLTVLQKSYTKNNMIYWECQCECGKKVIVSGQCLRRGNTKSCGCLRKEKVSLEKTIDITGQVFEHLTVLRKATKKEVLENTSIEKDDKKSYWWVQCDCGSLPFVVMGKSLREGKTKSCGHLRYELGKEKIKNLIGQRFGQLEVIDFTGIKDHRAMWHCKCDCGNEKDICGTLLANNKVKSCGCINSLGENKICNILNKNNIQFEQQKTFNTCISPISQSKLRFDFYINNQYLLEYDGEQHFSSRNSGWNNEKNLKETQYRDNLKNEWCKKNNIPLIRIPYTQFDNLCLEDLLLETSNFIV